MQDLFEARNSMGTPRKTRFLHKVLFGHINKEMGIENEPEWQNYFLFTIYNKGGNIRLMVVGSAPMADNILSFIRTAVGRVGLGMISQLNPKLSIRGRNLSLFPLWL